MDSNPRSRRYGEAVPRRATWVLDAFNPDIEPPPSLRSPGKAMTWQEGGQKQLPYERAEEQADEAVNGGSKGQIECGAKLSNTVAAI